jgi:hypothetical protein
LLPVQNPHICIWGSGMYTIRARYQRDNPLLQC